ncbi:MAG: SCP2 sterol-binding domain-containing protein [Betaproteobacteria bacterium]|nr:SCP2 sterol-binding domain-containing protein [Betaproteobacteria bacterium]
MLLPTIPAALPRLIAHLPMAPVSYALSVGLNRIAWRGLQALDWTPMHGRSFAIRILDLGVSAGFRVGPSGFSAAKVADAAVTFSASAEDFVRLALRLEDPDTLFFNRRLLIEGDTDLGLAAKNLLDGVELETLTAQMPMPVGMALNLLRQRLTLQ